ncbi:hypothetical protein MRS44_018878 [Fusarium solani]|uniref:uncharacterized protein n=1 Tax=Fusarium solani TaxID=169388 RepID=UPI0032C3ECF3|nr:hypothetical protein MRS44_018878 [Fusarium solani]
MEVVKTDESRRLSDLLRERPQKARTTRTYVEGAARGAKPATDDEPPMTQRTATEHHMVEAGLAMKTNKKLTIRAAAKVYNIPRTTLARRRDGRPARRDTLPNSRKLTELEEDAIVQYILELCERSFPPRLRDVKDMANQLLRARDASGVGKNWASSFVRRRPELRTRFSRKYDYQRAKCEDPKVIGEWFTLVQNVKAKYGIPDEDTYNFDETGFMMGMIFACMVVTTSDGRSKDKLAQPGNREWATVIQGVNAQGWAIPPFILAARYHLANWTPRAISRPTGSLQQSVSYEGHLSAVDP